MFRVRGWKPESPKVYDVRGKIFGLLVDRGQQPGKYQARADERRLVSAAYSSGLTSSGADIVGRMMLVK